MTDVARPLYFGQSVMNASGDINISSSWSVKGEKKIKDCITFCVQGEATRDTLENVSLDTCILLHRDTNDKQQLEVAFSVPDNVQITHLSVVSEARMLEVYGKSGEYLSTVEAEFVDDFADLEVYVSEINIDQNLSECSIKFARFRRLEDMWLYSINLMVKEAKSPLSPIVDFQNVEKFIKGSADQNNEKLEKFSKYLNLYNTVICTGAESKPGNLLMLKNMLKFGFSEINANAPPKYLNNTLPIFESRLTSGSEPVSIATDPASLETDSGSLLTDIKDDSSKENNIEIEAKERISGGGGSSRNVGIVSPNRCNGSRLNAEKGNVFQMCSEEEEGKFCHVKHHLSELFIQMENRLMEIIDRRFKEMEIAQNEKLDKVLKSVETLPDKIEKIPSG